MIARALMVVIVAGLVAGLCVTAAQSISTSRLIAQAEVYETTGHDDHTTKAWTPRDGWQRIAFSGVANSLIGLGFGALLIVGFVLRRRKVGWRDGVFWGLGGFLVFAVAPALGLAPELPGVDAAALFARQAWWTGAVLASGVGLALMAFSATPYSKIAGAALLVAPHLIGAPRPEELTIGVPAWLAAEFAVASLAVGAFFWVVLGASAGFLYDRWVLRPKT